MSAEATWNRRKPLRPTWKTTPDPFRPAHQTGETAFGADSHSLARRACFALSQARERLRCFES